MSAKAQAAGIKASAYTIIVETRGGKDAYNVGPFRSFAKAETESNKFNSMPGLSASVEPIYTPADFHRIQTLQ